MENNQNTHALLLDSCILMRDVLHYSVKKSYYDRRIGAEFESDVVLG